MISYHNQIKEGKSEVIKRQLYNQDDVYNNSLLLDRRKGGGGR
jgi:hypothetical protein